MTRRVLKMRILLAWMLVLLIPCSAATAEKKAVLRMGIYAGGRWDMPIANSDQFFDLLIESFEARFPDVEVIYESGVMKEDYSDWLADGILRGETPDVFLVLQSDLCYLARIGVLEDLGAWMARDTNYDPNAFFSSALNEGVTNGRHYALAYEVAPMLMLANKTLLEELCVEYPQNDWTLEDFYQVCRQVTRDTDGDGRIDYFGVYDYSWKDVVHGANVRLFDEDGAEARFSQPAMQNVIAFMKRMEALNTYQKPGSNDFDSGRVAFRPFLFSAYKTYKPYPYRLKKYSNFEWDCLPMPGRGGEEGASVLQSALIGMNAHSKEKELAWELIRQILSEDMQKDLIDHSYGIPVLKTIFEDPEAELLQAGDALNVGTILDVVEKAISEPLFDSYLEAMDVADREISAVINTDVDISRALMELNNKINSMLPH